MLHSHGPVLYYFTHILKLGVQVAAIKIFLMSIKFWFDILLHLYYSEELNAFVATLN